ncbi:MAG: DUF4402 domain-containing protein [Pseudomonadota bacterium]
MATFIPNPRPKTALIVALIIGVATTMYATSVAQSGSSDPEFEGNAGAVIINGLRVIKRQDLHFGTIAPSLTEFGTVQTNRGRNNDSVCGPTLTCFAPGTRARFTVIGEANRIVTISDPGSIWITDAAGNQMLVDSFTGAGSGNNTHWRGWQRLRPSGISRFNVGATLYVNPNQPRGTYVGQFTLNFEYQ